MPAAMHLTILISLLTVTACSETTVFSTTPPGTLTTTTASHVSSSSAPSSTVKTTAITSSSAMSSTVKTTAITSQAQTTTHPITTDATSTALKTTKPNETSPSNTTLNTTAAQTSNETVSHKQTVQSTELVNVTATHANVTAGTSVNATSPDLLTNKENDSLAANPGLVAILCIFCIVLTLALVVITVKCIQSPRANFERLEETPMGKMSEESPFAHYSK